MQHQTLALFLFMVLANCSSSNQTAFESSLKEYQNGQWLVSEMWAKKSIESNKSVAESQYMMGLCEFKRQQFEEAQEWFTKAASSSNKDVHGKATAMLGIIAENEGDFAAAEKAFSIAAIELVGADRREAASRTTASIGNAGLISNHSFSLQFGAFRSKTNAELAVSNLSPKLSRVGIHSIWVTENTDRTGRKLYLVQAGHFASRTSAANRKKNGDLPQCIVIATD